MSNKVSVFKFENSADIRVVDIDGNPWFAARDVLAALGLTDDRNHTKKLSDDEKQVVQRSNVNLLPGLTFPNRGANCISESGLYKLVMRSDKAEARRFQDWVTRDVLPAIRKDGAYIMGEEKVATGELDEDAFVLKAIEILQRKIDRLSAENKVMHDELNLVTIDEYRALTHRYFDHGMALREQTLAAPPPVPPVSGPCESLQ